MAELDKKMKELDRMISDVTGSGAKASETAIELRKRDSMARVEKFMATVKAKESPAHRVAVDFGGGVIAQTSTELINWGLRALGKWSGDGFWANNVDLLQGAPHFILGLAIYFAEMLTRGEPKEGKAEWVSGTREVMSEAAKIFGQLGFSNLMRAVRVRWAESNDREVAYQAIVDEKKAAEAKLAKLQAGQK